MGNNKYWEFKAKDNSNEADLYLYLEIASWGGGWSAHSAKSFKSELDDLGEINILNIYINSPGGDVFEGNAIYNILKRKATKCQLNIYIDGLAASIASVIAMSGKVMMPKNTMLMIHNAWTYAIGNSNELRKLADDMDKINKSIKEAYLNKAGLKLDEETITNLMDNETWLTAQEAYDYGLCDEVLEEKNIAAKYDDEVLRNFKNVPKAFFVAENEENQQQNVMDQETKALIERINNKSKIWNLGGM